LTFEGHSYSYVGTSNAFVVRKSHAPYETLTIIVTIWPENSFIAPRHA